MERKAKIESFREALVAKIEVRKRRLALLEDLEGNTKLEVQKAIKENVPGRASMALISDNKRDGGNLMSRLIGGRAGSTPRPLPKGRLTGSSGVAPKGKEREGGKVDREAAPIVLITDSVQESIETLADDEEYHEAAREESEDEGLKESDAGKDYRN